MVLFPFSLVFWECALVDNRGLMVSGIPPGEIFNYWPNLGGQVGTYCMIR